MFLNNKGWGLLFLSGVLELYASLAFPAVSAYSWLKQGHPIFQFGGYWSNPGQAQHIDIQGLIGDEFTVTSANSSNILFGIGYFLDSQEKSSFKISYGINAFYLEKTLTKGNVIQENLFTNLAYQYNLTHFPVYVMAKSTFLAFSKYALTLDAGIGPNFIVANGFKENSLDGQTIPDHIFSSHRSSTLSTTAGIGVKINQFFGELPLECGYRFFYLGRTNFLKANNQVLNTLETGNIYANAILCSVSF